MRTQNDINYRYHPKSFEEIKTEIQKSRKLGLTKAKRKKLDWGLQERRNISGTGITQKEAEGPNPVSIFIIVALVLAIVPGGVLLFIMAALIGTIAVIRFMTGG